MASPSSQAEAATPVTPTAGVTAANRGPVVARLRAALGVLAGTPRVLALVWNAHPHYAVAVLTLNVLQGFQPVVNAWLNKLVIDAIAVAVVGPADPLASTTSILTLLGVRAVYQAISAAMGGPARYFWQQLSDQLTREVQRLILNKANSFNGIGFFESPRFFDLLQRAQNQVSYRPINIVNNLTFILRTSIGLVSMTAAFFLFSPWLTVLIVIASVPNLVIQFRNRRESYAINNRTVPEVRMMDYFSRVLTDKVEAKEVRLFGLGDHFLGQFQETFEAFRRQHEAVRFRHWYWSNGLAALSAGAHALGYGAIVLAAVEGKITLGDLLFYTTALSQILVGLNGLVWQLSSLYESNLYVGNLFELTSVQETLLSPAPSVRRQVPVPLRYGIELRGVGFGYDGAEKPVLEDVSFTIAPGQVVALVGENGAGKSTLVKLLTRLYDPTAGQVLVDGVDLRELDLEEWRRRIAVVFQDFKNYTMLVRENIGLGDLGLIDDAGAVRAAALRAGADALVERMPDKYETMLGRRFKSIGNDGVDLSGGEWQRIALARAFMRAPVAEGRDAGAQLLILDEPTAALDARAEHQVYLRFKELTAGRATLLISHRFSTVRMADHIVVLDGGRIVEQGSHDELAARGGMYARLYAMQAERYA